MRNILFIILFGLGLVIPATVNGQESGDTLSLNPSYATIYFYRKPEFYSGRYSCSIGKVQLVSKFRSSTYFWLNLPAGTYEIKTRGRFDWTISEKKYNLKVEAGQVYYIEGVIEYGFLGATLFLIERKQTDLDQLKDKLTFDASAKRTLE